MIPDPLDARLGFDAEAERRVRRRASGITLALGLSPTRVPGLILLPLGMAVGPHGLGLLSPTVLSYLEPAVSVAIATLGVLIGLGLDVRRPHERLLLTAASVEAAITITLVGAGVLLAWRVVPFESGLEPWLVALLLGLCAASSSTTAIEGADRAHATRIGDLDDLLPIVLGGLAIASIRESAPEAATWLAAQSVAIALVIAAAGWLLVAASASESDQRVFAVGTLLLLGGAVEYLSLSALLAGLVTGAFWNAAGGAAQESLARDVRHVQHPLVVLLLLIAGARVSAWPVLPLLALIYLLFRIAGKIAGGWIASRFASRDLPALLGLYLISPGVIAVAFALNAMEASGSDRAGLVLAVAVVGSFASELVSLVVHPRGEPA